MNYPRVAAMLASTVLATAAIAQQPAMSFRLAPANNPSTCIAADAAMSRVHTVAVAGDTATIKSNGGVNDKAKMVSPGIYRTRWSVGGISYDIEINTTAAPPTLSVVEPKLGCRWSGTAA